MSETCSGSCSSCASGCKSEDKLSMRMQTVKHKILVLSGKGGVGKSTVAATVAVSLAREGFKVGLLDVDFHGPSQPTLFNLQHFRLEYGADGFIPAEVGGIKLVSLGLLVDDPNQAVIWRGPVKNGVIRQLLEETLWGELDYLILDFPPGNGDEVLSASQMIPGEKMALVVTTPQEVALADCRKCLNFCEQLQVKVMGIVENMSGFICPDCHHRHDLFSKDGGQKLSEQYHIPLLAKIPLDPVFLQQCDQGNLPAALQQSDAVREAVGAVANALIHCGATENPV